jgi:hypothetical protein
MTMETSKILHFQNCTSNCANSLRVLELSRTVSNPCSQKSELNNPDNHHCHVHSLRCKGCAVVSSHKDGQVWIWVGVCAAFSHLSTHPRAHNTHTHTHTHTLTQTGGPILYVKVLSVVIDILHCVCFQSPPSHTHTHRCTPTRSKHIVFTLEHTNTDD